MTQNTFATPFNSPIVIGAGERDFPPAITKVANVPVATSLELQDNPLLLPRLTTAERDALTPTVEGMEIYNSTTGAAEILGPTGWSGGGGGGGLQSQVITITGDTAIVAACAAQTPFPIFTIPVSGLFDILSVRIQLSGQQFTGGGASLQVTVRGNEPGGIIYFSLQNNPLFFTIPTPGLTSFFSRRDGADVFGQATAGTDIAFVMDDNGVSPLTGGNATTTLTITALYTSQ